MNVLIVQVNLISHFPPTRNLINVLLKNGHNVTVITTEDENFIYEKKEGVREL